MSTTLGFIGLGTMGAFMAANLSKYLETSNHGFVVHDIRKSSAEPFLAKGAEWADSPKALAEQCDVVFLSLPGPKEVEAVTTDSASGLIAGLKKGGTVIVVGLFGGDITVPTPYLPMRAMTLRGSYVGSQGDMAELLDLVKRTGMPAVPIRTRRLEDVNETLNDLRAGKIVGRVVLTPAA